MKLEGIIVPLATPFKSDYKLDEECLAQEVGFLLDHGIRGFLVNGSTGECVSLSAEERERTINVVSNACKKKAFVIAGVEFPSTWEAISEAKRARKAGADFALVATPYYLKPTMEGISEHYKSVAESGIPILLYNNPYRTTVLLDTKTLHELLEVRNIVGMKQSHVDMNQTAEILRLAGDKTAFIHSYGDAVSIFPGLLLGGVGAMAITACFVPEKVLQLYEATTRMDLKTAKRIYTEILPLLRHVAAGVHGEPNPAPFKEALRLIGRPAGPTRPPVKPVTEDTRESIRKVLKNAGLIK